MHFLKHVSTSNQRRINTVMLHELRTCQAVNSLLYLRLLAFALDELVEILSVFRREALDGFGGDL